MKDIKEHRYNYITINENRLEEFIELEGYTEEELLERAKKDDKVIEISDIYKSDDIVALCFLTLVEIIKNNLIIKKCINCGMYFIPNSRIDEVYCEYSKGKDKTCREKGAVLTYTERLKQNKALAEYRRLYQQKSMAVGRNKDNKQMKKDFEQEVIAFLNYKEGGIIYVGINKNGQVVGVENTDLTQLQIKDRIKNNIQPSTLGLFDVTVETIDNKEVIKVIISSGTEKPYYLRKKGRTPEGCYIRVGSSKERMTERMIDDMYARRIKNTLKEIDSPRQELTFNQLKIYYEEHGLKLNDNFLQNLDLLTSEGKYNYNAFLLADENTVSIKLVRYLGTNKL